MVKQVYLTIKRITNLVLAFKASYSVKSTLAEIITSDAANQPVFEKFMITLIKNLPMANRSGLYRLGKHHVPSMIPMIETVHLHCWHSGHQQFAAVAAVETECQSSHPSLAPFRGET
jgi:hypothetical protein